MTVTYQTVTIGSSSYDVYADVASADEYLNAEANADAWRAAEDDAKGRALVTATRILNALTWAGTPTEEDGLAWPRTGVTINGVAVDPDVIPQPIIDASILLANEVINGTDLANFVSTAQTQRRIKAGSVEVENFRMVGGPFAGYPLPKQPWLLIVPYTDSPSYGVGARSRGTCGRSILDRNYDHSTGI